MAIDYHDLAAVTDQLKYVYGMGMRNMLNEAPITYNQFPKSDRRPGGKGYVFGIRNERNQGGGARGEAQKLPDPLVGKFDQSTITPKYNYQSMRISGPTREIGKSNVEGFVNTVADMMDDGYKSLEMDLNRQCWGDGFGLLATLSEASDALTTSSTTWTVTADNDRGMMYVRDGQLVDFYNSTAVDQSAVASRVSYVDVAAKTCEMEFNDGTYKANHPISGFSDYTIATDTVASGSFMVKMGTRDAVFATTDTSYELTGLKGIFDDGTLISSFQDITVSTAPKWQAWILGNSSANRELSIDLMLQAVDLVRRYGGTSRKVQMRMGLGQRRKYANLLMPDVRFAPEVLKGGYSTLSFNGGDGSVEIVIDPFAQPNQIYMHPEGEIKKYELTPLSWGDPGEGMMQRQGYDLWDMFLKIYTELGVEQRNSLVLIDDLVEPNIYS